MSKVICTLCGGMSFTAIVRGDLQCDGCMSLPRTRMLGLALMRAAPPAGGKPVVHVAPERGLAPFLRGRYGEAYTPADFDTDRYSRQWLMSKIKFLDLARTAEFYPPNSVWGFVHAHVIEHVPAPIDRVLTEMNAAVAPGGFHAFIVPGMADRYEEDLTSNKTPKERDEQYGHPEHMRIFGRDDWDEVVLRHFAGWTKVDLAAMIGPEELRIAAIPAGALTRLTGKTVHMFIKN